MSKHQGYLLLPLSAEHLKRLSDLPLASSRSSQRQSLVETAHYFDMHVLAWCHVSLRMLPLKTILIIT